MRQIILFKALLMFIELISDFFFFQKCVIVVQHQKNIKREINAKMIIFWIDMGHTAIKKTRCF